MDAHTIQFAKGKMYMKYIKQDIYELIPAIAGFVTFLLIRFIHGPISAFKDPAYSSFILLVTSVVGFICLWIGRGKQTKFSFLKLLISSIALAVIGFFFLHSAI